MSHIAKKKIEPRKGLTHPPDNGIIDLGIDQALMFLMTGGKTKIHTLRKCAKNKTFHTPAFLLNNRDTLIPCVHACFAYTNHSQQP